MQARRSDNHPNSFDNEIDLLGLFNILFEGRWIIVFLTSFATFVGVIYSLLLPNIYESKAILFPVDPSSGIYSALGSYSGIAGLAGISLPFDDDDGNSAKAIKTITSLSFFENNILANIYLPNLMAVKSWDPKTNTLNFDADDYDIDSSTWIRDYSYPQQQIPSAQESFEVFKEDHLRLIEDKKSGFITLSIKHQSPIIAKQWVELIVNQVNNFYRQKDKLEAEKAASYLNQQISMTSLSEIKQVIAQLLQEQTKKLTLIEANQYYVFDYIDPPAVMEKKIEPKRVLICFISLLFGGMLSILIVLFRNYVFKGKAS